ncbi:MAG: hypothetical protein PUE14_06655 [Clostridia bacterium]|nr:hypothetical protein [Clostridia bacterium]
MKQFRKTGLLLLLCAMLWFLNACHENPSQQQLYSRMFAHFESYGLACELQTMEPEREAPIYKSSAWWRLMLNGEEVLVYFDDSNRADYLCTFVDEEAFGTAWRFGLRFVLVYAGEDPAVLQALNAIEND